MSTEPRVDALQNSRDPAGLDGLSLAHALLLWAAFAAISLAILQPALRGAFINDDFSLILKHPYLNPLNRENLIAILDPFGDAAIHGVNYAPVMLLLHALEKALFGGDTLGYHVVNAVIHALNCVLLIALLIASRVPRLAALLAGLFFAAHPANVEAVAWISQLKTDAALAFALGAVLSHRRFPALALTLFALGLLTKASAMAALPMAAALGWSRRDPRRLWVWLAGWAIAAGLYAVPELRAQVATDISPYSDVWVQIRSIFSFWARYLAMAATSYGISPFQEPEPVRSILDPWWIGGFLTAALLGWRTIATLRARSAEAAYWILAAASFGPVSQIWPFMHAMADRYLYFILPGLIGGSLLAAMDLGARWTAAEPGREARIRWASSATRCVAFGTVLVILAFGSRSHARAALWQEEFLLLEVGAQQFPNGANAAYYRALLAAERRDAETAVRELRAASQVSLGHMARFSADPRFEPIAREPVFHELIDEITGRWIEFARSRGLETQTWLRSTGQAHRVRGEYREAIDCFERALRLGGPLQSALAIEVESTRTLWREARKAEKP
ncbi:MAG: tetratricopeptide repeat protein [Deltaproteobacteria bacterium]|jgi:tetratricopeptide (TPR) repeat protein|nr:tetratricopeptide repeat protein [Deltaproteobacteria bacterium]